MSRHKPTNIELESDQVFKHFKFKSGWLHFRENFRIQMLVIYSRLVMVLLVCPIVRLLVHCSHMISIFIGDYCDVVYCLYLQEMQLILVS